ncbi:hypothetical protein [Brevibacillus brevis]|uniref:hypothetical protein n=1 Tax=Brevibacillus brevis TaxID=1393 RepID=UPI0018FF5AF3|nr:hypothetical protein [Brevibacillus brevis]
MGGAFLTSREIFSNPIWTNVLEFRLFFLIYGNAVFSDEGVRVGDIILQRGQWLRSIRNLQKDLEYTENRAVKTYSTATIKRAIDSLVIQNRIKVETAELGTLFTVVNYAVYQGFEHYETVIAKRRGNSNETATKQQRNNNNNVKKEKNDKKVKEEKIRHLDSVLLTQKQIDTLVKKYGQEGFERIVKILDDYKTKSGKQYDSDYLAITRWVAKRYLEDLQKVAKGGRGIAKSGQSYDELYRDKDFGF